MKRKIQRRLFIGFAIVVLVCFACMYFVGMYEYRVEIDTVSGSRREYRQWDWWGRTNETVQMSSLEKWIIQKEGSYQNN